MDGVAEHLRRNGILREIILGAASDGIGGNALIALSSEHDDGRRRWAIAQELQETKPIHVRKAVVKEDKVRKNRLNGVETVLSGLHRCDFEPHTSVLAQHAPNNLNVGFIVLD
jgi:hypothetical protein